MFYSLFALEVFGECGMGAATLCGLATLLATCRPRPRARANECLAPITVLKPLCGAESRLESCLESLCAQDYPLFQIVFGVAEADDPALAVVYRLRDRFPSLDIDIVVDNRRHGANAKVSNLINMMRAARFDTLVLADSDIRVGPNYLRRVTAPLDDPRVGLATCLYRATAVAGRWSRCHAMFINDWFLPMVLLAERLGFSGFAFGATIAIRRDTLAAAGGFRALADQLADDYMLGARVRRAGLATVLSEYVVETVVDEHELGSMHAREVRWMRTLRALTPVSYAFSAVSFGGVVSLGALALGYAQPSVWALAAVTVGARIALHYRQSPGRPTRELWLLPVRDVLLCWAWARGFGRRRISWRGEQYRVTGHGTLQRSMAKAGSRGASPR